jgi:hypothetical protein
MQIDWTFHFRVADRDKADRQLKNVEKLLDTVLTGKSCRQYPKIPGQWRCTASQELTGPGAAEAVLQTLLAIQTLAHGWQFGALEIAPPTILKEFHGVFARGQNARPRMSALEWATFRVSETNS